MDLTKDQLKELHSHLLALLTIVDQFCRENDLRYYLLGGSALGAMRHGGFIPWDDDIDIGLPRKDYDKFIKEFPRDGIGQAVLKSNTRNRRDHVYPWIKIEDRFTHLEVDWHKHIYPQTGVFIDVFPIDGAPENPEKRQVFAEKIQKLRFQLAYTYFGYEPKNFLKRLIIRIIRSNLTRWIITRFNDFYLRKYSYENSKFVGNPMGEYGNREIMDKNIYGNPREINFEDIVSYVPENTNAYLDHLYGDNWNQMPPIEKRKSAHNWSELSFEKNR